MRGILGASTDDSAVRFELGHVRASDGHVRSCLGFVKSIVRVSPANVLCDVCQGRSTLLSSGLDCVRLLRKAEVSGVSR